MQPKNQLHPLCFFEDWQPASWNVTQELELVVIGGAISANMGLVVQYQQQY